MGRIISYAYVFRTPERPTGHDIFSKKNAFAFATCALILLLAWRKKVHQTNVFAASSQPRLNGDVARSRHDGAIALAFFGSLPREQGSRTCPSLLQLKSHVLPTLIHNLLAPNVKLGFEFTLFSHTWWWLGPCFDCSSSETGSTAVLPCGQNLTETLADLFTEVSNSLPAGKVRIGQVISDELPDVQNTVYFAFASIERNLDILNRYVEEGDGYEPRNVMLLRWDLMFFTPFLFKGLTPHMFYRSNWCRASGETQSGSLGQMCHKIAPYHACNGPSDGRGSPDFWVIGDRPTLRAAFNGTAQAVLSHTLGSDGCCCMHGNLNHVFSRAHERGVQLGRYQYHHMDYDFVRNFKSGEIFIRHGDAERWEKVLQGKAAWLEQPGTTSEPNYQYNVSSPQLNSRCDVSLHYCNWTNKTYRLFSAHD